MSFLMVPRASITTGTVVVLSPHIRSTSISKSFSLSLLLLLLLLLLLFIRTLTRTDTFCACPRFKRPFVLGLKSSLA